MFQEITAICNDEHGGTAEDSCSAIYCGTCCTTLCDIGELACLQCHRSIEALIRRVFEWAPCSADALQTLGERAALRRAYRQAPQHNKPIYATITKELEKDSNRLSAQVYTVTKEVNISNQRGLRIRNVDIVRNERYVTCRFGVAAHSLGILVYGESLDEAFYHLGEYVRRHGRCSVETGCGQIFEGDECSDCALHHALQSPIECGTCFQLTTYDYETECGHHYCKSCLGKLEKMECPVCRDSRGIPISTRAGTSASVVAATLATSAPSTRTRTTWTTTAKTTRTRQKTAGTTLSRAMSEATPSPWHKSIHQLRICVNSPYDLPWHTSIYHMPVCVTTSSGIQSTVSVTLTFSLRREVVLICVRPQHECHHSRGACLRLVH